MNPSAPNQPQQPAGNPAPGIVPPIPGMQTQQGGAVVGGSGNIPPRIAPGGKPAVKNNPNSTQNALHIAEIRDGIVIMNDGSFRSVIMAKSINFDLMSPQEREAVESSYQRFLNSLFFPIQISMRSERVDMRPYMEKLDKIRSEQDNMLLALLMEDYIGFIGQMVSQTNIMDKKTYVVIPYFPVADVQKALTQSKNFFSGLVGLFNNKEQHVVINEKELEDAKTELRNRVQSVLEGLLQCGIQAIPLSTQELIELYYNSYNPETSTRQPLKNFNDLTAPVVTKGKGEAPRPNLEPGMQ